ncbi:MAG: hypothetical protein VXA26_12775, partial [Candidatus Neomarinimicrobiota bacterium]
MKNIYLLITAFILSCSPATQSNKDVIPDGYKMLLMGNSFFRPYAEKFDDMVSYTEIENHDATTVFRGGENGNPYNFWNDSDTNQHQQIKSVLDQGNIELFGMTSGASEGLDIPDILSGHRNWIQYAVDKNPNISIFIAIPAINYPADWVERAEEFGLDTVDELYDYFENSVHSIIIDQLRIEFPSTTIFTIPTGRVTQKITQMYNDNSLLDDIDFFGTQSTAIFRDALGHQGDIALEGGGMVWLNSIYQINLEDYNYDTGFN